MSEEKENKKSVEDNSSRTFIITLAVIIVLFAAMLIGFKFYQDTQVKTYNNFKFEKNNILWTTTVQKGQQPYQIPFYYPPWELEDIITDPNAEQLLLRASVEDTNKTVFITLHPDLKAKAVIAAVEISRITGDRYNMLNLETHGALTTEPEERSADAPNPIVTCANANNETIVIWLVLSDANVIHEENGCIILEGQTEEDLLRVADAFAYKLLGVMD